MSKSEPTGFSGKNHGNKMNSAPFGPAGSRGAAPAGTLSIADVWYALFRHKWKVILLSLLGIGAAAYLYSANKPPYVSEAKLLVRYVVETRSVEALGPDGEAMAPLKSGGNVVSAEGEILRSLDICRQVAESIGPARILGTSGEGSNSLATAAGQIYGGLTVDIPKLSNIIKVSLAHRDPEIAQLALQRLIEFYFKRHAEIHRGLGTMDAVLSTQTDQVRLRLVATDQELQELRTRSGIISPEESRRAITEQIGTIRQQILAAEAELGELRLLHGSGAVASNAFPPSSSSAITNAVPAVAVAVPESGVPAAKLLVVDTSDPDPVLSEASRQALLSRLESLRQQERDLRDLRTKAGPAGAGEGKHSYTDQIGRVRQMIIAAETELAESVTSKVTGKDPNSARTNVVAATLGVTNRLNDAGGSNAPASTAAVNPSEAFMEYKALLTRLESLHRQELELRNIYTDGNRTLIRVRQQLAEAQASRKTMELENPSFPASLNASADVARSTPGTVTRPGPFVSPGSVAGDSERMRALEVKLKILYAQLDKQKQEAVALEQFETQLNQLLRKRELDEKNYRHFAAGLEQTRFDEALGSGKLSNISIVQSPSPPALSEGKRMKLAGMALGVGVVGGIALAFLIELMLDHSVRRSGQLETSLALPLLSTIPRARLGRYKAPLAIGNGESDQTRSGAGGPDIPGWSAGHPLREHIEALRDRTLLHFEGDLRKPKLIGITGCREGAGVTTVACGLAAALSEVTEGRVLLINLDPRSQSLHPLLLGRNACSVVDVVEAGKRETGLIGNNLYVASNLGEANGNAVLQPTNISRLLPKIKMSDYDYVVFDMPPVTQTSVSGKLAGMVDLVFMVAESEKDSQKGLKRACQLLAESNANYRVVLNKFERYVPKWLEQEG